MDNRSSKAEVRNPVLALPSVAKLKHLPEDSREALRDILFDLRKDAQEKAEKCWLKHKGPMAVYYRAISVYAGHIARLLR
jgi:hypothetical protein